MNETAPFEFKRTKGIVWVCDLAKSSSYLNSNELVDEIEAFIPRMYFISKLIVESFGGKYLKWTGDGFLAFFEFELDRQKEKVSKEVFDAADLLTFMTNVTQLGLTPTKKFKIRHGITYEKDALLMNISSEKNSDSYDIIGRSVVLAFRLSGIMAEHPSIVTVKELAQHSDKKFKKWNPNVDEKLKFFKGERFGTENIYITSEKKHKPASLETTNLKAKKLVQKIETSNGTAVNPNYTTLVNAMTTGPDWCKKVLDEQVAFLRDDVLGIIKKMIEVVENRKQNGL